MDQDIIRFENIDPNDLEARLEAAKKEFEPLFAYINESMKKISIELKEDSRIEKELSDAYHQYVMRGFDSTARSIDMIEMRDRITDNSGHAARMAREECDDLHSKYGRYVKK